MPERCTLVPGAWLAISTLAVADGTSTGRGSCGSGAAERRIAADAAGADAGDERVELGRHVRLPRSAGS